MMRRNIVRNSSGNGLPCTGETIRLDICNDFLCPDIQAVIAVPSLLLALLIIIFGIAFYWRIYKRIDNDLINFNMPNIVKITK